ncbi:hypothetical protein GCM10009809_33540 [Isoptericola hypogeus]|uniref:CopC domain-containing protein n=1 Tax=Isoptericola hypogeus TaxID=300179 RepID=A0ABP4VRF4_9MICO
MTGATARRGRPPAITRVLAAAGATLLATGAATLVAVSLGAAPASAHNVVVGTSPGVGSTVTQAPAEVSVTFDDVVLELGADSSSTVVQVTDARGDDHATGCPAAQDRTVAVPVSIDEPGEYTVTWRIVSADGHPTSGEFAFTYAQAGAGSDDAGTDDGAASAAPAPVSCGGSAGTQAADSDDAAAAAPSASAGGSSDLLVALGIAGGVVVLGGAGVLVALRASRRRG